MEDCFLKVKNDYLKLLNKEKIFGKSAEEQPSAEQPNKYERRKALVSEQWRSYQETKNPRYLATICRELPFFDHPEVGEEIASLLLKK